MKNGFERARDRERERETEIENCVVARDVAVNSGRVL